MESTYEGCLAVFSTQGSPFSKTASSRSHYHPSQAQLLSPEQRRLVLSPSRLQARTLPAPSKKAETLSPPRLNFSPVSSYPGVQVPNVDSTSPFSESWPSTERSSSPLTPEGGNALPKPPESASVGESVIARYIERFRYGQPQTRQERWASGGRFPPLWWLNRSFLPEGHLSKKEAPPSSDSGRSEARSSPLSYALDRSNSGESRETSNLDLDTVYLQERAAKLLHRSSSPSSSSKHLSSEAPSFTSTNAEMDTAGNAPQPITRHQHKDSLGAVPDRVARRVQSGSSLKPEEDILFQWRLRRKMEEASKAVAVLPPAAWRTPLPTCTPNMMEGAALKLPEATTGGSYGRTLPALGVDVTKSTHHEHPCCCGDSTRNAPRSGQPIETAPFTTRNGIVGSPEPSREQGVEKQASPEGPVAVCLDSSRQRSTGTRRTSDPSPLPHAQRTAQSVERTCSHPRGSQWSLRAERDRAEPGRDSEEPSVSPPQSSVQRALGEVIAERLFSSPEPPAPSKDECQWSTKNRGLEEAAPSTVSSPSHPQLLSMAAQLLEQAEDSDGTEFEDDPLLQVLRGKRECLRNQLRAVDAQVARLEGGRADQDSSHR